MHALPLYMARDQPGVRQVLRPRRGEKAVRWLSDRGAPWKPRGEWPELPGMGLEADERERAGWANHHTKGF